MYYQLNRRQLACSENATYAKELLLVNEQRFSVLSQNSYYRSNAREVSNGGRPAHRPCYTGLSKLSKLSDSIFPLI